MRTRANDPHKVHELMDSIREIGLQVPIDVLEVDGVYYGFSGCHRYEAHQRLGLPTIRCKVRRGTQETLSAEELEAAILRLTVRTIEMKLLVRNANELGVQQGMTSRGKAVKAPNKEKRKKLPIRKYATRSKAFKSSFFGNDKDPINLD
nr:sulfiredoxin, chloroplastic/mitochondrial [Ipomoea batatas]